MLDQKEKLAERGGFCSCRLAHVFENAGNVRISLNLTALAEILLGLCGSPKSAWCPAETDTK
jgi:hypothetical protein